MALFVEIGRRGGEVVDEECDMMQTRRTHDRLVGIPVLADQFDHHGPPLRVRRRVVEGSRPSPPPHVADLDVVEHEERTDRQALAEIIP